MEGVESGGPDDCIDKIVGEGGRVEAKVRRGEAGIQRGSEQLCM